jgi:hypothetical protein
MFAFIIVPNVRYRTAVRLSHTIYRISGSGKRGKNCAFLFINLGTGIVLQVVLGNIAVMNF